jgi:hypothetical protein
MAMFDMTLKEAASAFSVTLDWLRAVVTYGSGIGHTRYGGKVQSVTSADLAAHLAQLRERAAVAAGGEGK